MERPPRPVDAPIVTRGLLGKALAQGLAIFAAAFGSYYLTLPHGGPEHARTFFLTVLVLSNLFLVYVNRSDKDFAFAAGCAAIDKTAWFVNIGVLLCLIVMSTLPQAAAATKLQPLSPVDFTLALLTAAGATFWWEAVKWAGRKNR